MIHFPITYIQNTILKLSSVNALLYVSLTIVMALALVMFYHFAAFGLLYRLIQPMDRKAFFEYKLGRNWLKGILYIFLSFLVSAEILAAWQLGWVQGWMYLIPLWMVFIYLIVMAFIKASSFKGRANYLTALRKKVDK